MRLFMILTAFILMLAPMSAQAALERYEFDKEHTQILFFVNHLGFSNSHGEFLDFDGGFDFNESDPDKGAVEISINTNSIDMSGIKSWNKHMKSKDFFNVEKFPTMDFVGTHIEVTGDNTAKITGDLTLLGVTKPVTLDVVFNKAGKHPMEDKYVAGFSASGHLKRSDFGMNFGVPMIGNDIEMRIQAEGHRPNGTSEN